jgi:uracil phosphoribosyltransferase
MNIFAFLFIGATLFGQSQALNQLVYEIRNPNTDAAHFRGALEKIGEHLAREVLEELDTKETSIQTLTGVEAKHTLVDEMPVLVTILRAGLPLNAGVHKVFPEAEVGFLAMARNEETLKASVDYIALPDLRDRSVIIVDTMIATADSMLNALRIVKECHPKQIFVIAGIAAQFGIDRILAYNPEIKIFAAAIDPALNEKGYIIPGLGDAGDRSYGVKHFKGAASE